MTFEIKDIKSLRAARQQALEKGKDIFEFKGLELDVGYAKYLIEYLETQLRN